VTSRRILILDSPIIAGSCIVPDRDKIHHLRDVLRVKVGYVVFVTDGQGQRWISHVVDDNGAFGLLVEGLAPALPACSARIGLILASLKSGRTEWAIEKATECGVAEVRVFVADRSVAKPGQDTAKTGRFARIAIEAARQCGRDDVPGVSVWQNVNAAVTSIEGATRFILDERPGALPLTDVLCMTQETSAWLAIGPEGSFTDRERDVLALNGFIPANLGPRILRAETAAIAAVLLAQATIGDMGGA